MSIRSATIDDAPRIAELVRSLSHHYLDNPQGKLPDWFCQTLSLQAFRQRAASGDYAAFVFARDGVIAGYLAMRGDSHLYHLFVHADQQRRGIARQLWQHALVRSQAECITLRSSLCAVAVYRRFGFSSTGPRGNRDGISFQPMELCRCLAPTP
ncbi:GNAT family N-acetyltransferase [Pseudomonas sp. CAU 1711]|uniref:GNAT family N-acetyltransferase n=1 Tax=Pseudomonas sp. CAU 1711 TaxID=3140356 RepID=UPI0032610506